MIDRYLLRYFLAVVDHGSFSRAAGQVNVTQPTLSVGIAKLERLLGALLFHRSAQRVHLTEAGSRFAIHARRIESEFNLAESAVLGLEPERIVRLGVLATIPNALLGDIVAQALAVDPRERVEIIEGNERDLLQRLQRGRIDLALTIIRDGGERFEAEALRTESYALAMPLSHPLAGQASVAGEALADNVMIVRRHCEVLSETSRYFIERGVRPFFAYRTTNDDRALALVRSGLGVTVMPASYRLDGVVRPALAGFDLSRTLGLLYAGHAGDLRHGASAIIAAIRAQLGAERAA